MKKIILIISILTISFSSVNEEFLDYTNKLVTYNFDLKNIDKLKSPFLKFEQIFFLRNKKIKKNIKKIVHISLISIFNNMARIKIEEFKGDELIKKYTRWVKLNDKIENCKVTKIEVDKIVLQCKNKTLIKTLNSKSINIKVEK